MLIKKINDSIKQPVGSLIPNNDRHSYQNIKYYLFLLVFMAVSIQRGLQANISQSFTESIPFVASGNYIYDSLDFMTTPFIYQSQKTDSLSLKFTRESGKEGLFATGRNSVFEFPVYWAVNLFQFGELKDIDPKLATVAGEVVKESENPNYRFMLGSHFKGFGIGVYVIISNRKSRKVEKSLTGGTDRDELTYHKSIDEEEGFYQPEGNSYGIEFGQSSLPIPMAWTLNLEYRKTGGSSFSQFGPVDNPETRTTFGAPSTIFSKELAPKYDTRFGELVASSNGNNRKEVKSNFLGWYTLIQKKLNVGLSYSLVIPFGSGRNSNLLFSKEETDEGKFLTLDGFKPQEELPRKTKLSGYDVSLTVFSDVDFLLLSETDGEAASAILKESTFRVTPAITYRKLQETLFYNDDHHFKGNYQYFSLDLQFKSQIVLGEKRNFFLFFGWLPRIIFIEEFKTMTKSRYAEVVLKWPLDVTQTTKSKVPDILYKTFSIGFSWLLFDKLKLNAAWHPNDNGDKFDLSLFDFGIDYYF